MACRQRETKHHSSSDEDEDVEKWLAHNFSEKKNEKVETREKSNDSQTTNLKEDTFVPLQQRTMTPYVHTYLNQHSYPVSVKPENAGGGRFHETGAVNKGAFKKHAGAVSNKLLERPCQLNAPVQSKSCNLPHPLMGVNLFKAPVQSKSCNLPHPLMEVNLVKVPVQSKACGLPQELNKVENFAQNSKKQFEKNRTPLEEKSFVNEQLQTESANIDGKKCARSRNRRFKKKNMQSNVEINQNESLDKSNCNDLKSSAGTSSAPNNDHPGTGENFGARKWYEPKIIIVSGVANTTTKDGLWNYMELMSGDCVETVEFLEKGKAVVRLRRNPGFNKLKNKISGHKLDEMQPKVERLFVCKSILVSGLPPEVTKDTVMLYFKNVRRSNGGNVVDVTLLKDTHSAVVTFQKSEVVSKVIAKTHSLANKELTVKKYYPQTDAQVTSESCGTSNDDKPKADDSTHVPVKSKVHDKRLKTSVEVDPDIMEYIMLGNHRKELEDKLDNLNAEIEWNNESNTATIWKKADSGYVEEWSKRCPDVLVEFLNRFKKMFFLLDEALRMSVNEALPRLAETISPEKALRKQVDEKLVVVCLEEGSENVTQSVNEFIEIIKKEEVRKTYQKETIKNVSHNHLLLLKHIKYAEKMKDEHAELEVILNVEKHEIYLEAPRGQFADTKIKYIQTKNEISEQTLVLPSYISNIVASGPGKKRIQENMARDEISAIVLPTEEDSVTVVAENFREYERARECICASMREAEISCPPGHNFIFEKKEWTQISGELNSRELINYSINYTEHLIALRGVSEIVDELEKKVKEYIDSQRIKELQRPVSQIVARFFKQNLSREVEGLTARLKDSQVSVEIKETDGIILYRGIESGLQECKGFLDELCRSISEKEKEFSSPGVNQLLFGETGQRYIKSIEVEQRVVIETRREEKINVKETLLLLSERETRRELLVTETRCRSASATKPAAPPLPGSTYDLCNFSTSEGVRVSWKYGNIADETADILVNSAHSDLSNPTACGRALNKVGGSSYIQACANYTSTLHAEAVACTTGGNLACSFVLHAVCCRWDNHQGKAETLLRNLVKEILRESNRRGAKSLAMPAIGTGLHRFPEDIVFRILKEEFQHFSASQSSPTLKDIRIIVFAKGPIAKQAPSPISQTPLQSSVFLPPPSKHGSSSSQSSRTSHFNPLNTGETKQIVKLRFVGRSVQQIDSSIDEVSKFVNDNTKKKEIVHEKVFDVFSKHWSDVEQLTRDYDVIITCNTPSVACIEGLVANVADCKEKLSQLVNKYVEEERQRKHLDYISNNVQWYYSQGGQSVKYDRELNGQIEMAHMENKEILQFTKSGDQYKIDFTEMTEKNSGSGQVERITRKRLGDTGSDVSLPEDWDPQPPGQVVHLVSLPKSSSEYQRVLNHFTSKGGTSRLMIKIERIQNPGLYKAYLVKKQSMNGEENEMQLFHGTNADNTHLINANNFSRSFAGINGVAYGNGVYFARDASYSLRYAKRGISMYHKMYVAKVLVGKHTTGAKGMKAPPSKNDPANPGVLYDSVVDNIHNPAIFVIFLDHQCYPEYLITFL